MKNVMRYILAAVFLLGVQSVEARQQDHGEATGSKLQSAGILRGDVNGDGMHTITDVAMLVNHLVGINTSGFHAEVADLNGDATVNITDVMILINIIIGSVPVPTGDDENPLIPIGTPEGGDPGEGV